MFLYSVLEWRLRLLLELLGRRKDDNLRNDLALFVLAVLVREYMPHELGHNELGSGNLAEPQVDLEGCREYQSA
jgi:hypothetical protein